MRRAFAPHGIPRVKLRLLTGSKSYENSKFSAFSGSPNSRNSQRSMYEIKTRILQGMLNFLNENSYVKIKYCVTFIHTQT
jgi:hypothetical protein